MVYSNSISYFSSSFFFQVRNLLKNEFEQDDFHSDFHTKKKSDHGHSHGGGGHSHGSSHGHSHNSDIQVSSKQIMNGK